CCRERVAFWRCGGAQRIGCWDEYALECPIKPLVRDVIVCRFLRRGLLAQFVDYGVDLPHKARWREIRKSDLRWDAQVCAIRSESVQSAQRMRIRLGSGEQ